ncbi:hypothetical protein COU36_03820 [Candidatus Micrarchaeota archaeon CG10_big_fil_rev_8_21_14_0_10_59_7]|nr:MAG: hypothetical protein COU36_03820 [Candidatus Micrarchaeota archaeon CG10_big_fil_rev_8_21_14_0_10_59_7]
MKLSTEGKPFRIGLDLASTNVPSLVGELRSKKFTGYLALCVKGRSGVEEAQALFDAGKIVACTYEYYKYEVLIEGEPAFKRLINACAAGYGVVDTYSLDEDALHLALVGNERAVFLAGDKPVQPPKVFSAALEEEAKALMEAQREDLLKKYKLANLKQVQK